MADSHASAKSAGLRRQSTCSLPSGVEPFSPQSACEHGVLGGLEQAKHDVRQIIDLSCKKREKDLYKTEGWAQHIAGSTWFGNLSVAVIAGNTVWLGVEADYNDTENIWDAELGFILVENMLCVYYVLELAVRFAAFASKRVAFKDPAYVFDCVLVVVMVLELWVLTTLFPGLSNVGSLGFLRLTRIWRVLRVARVARLARACPEIMVIIDGMRLAMRSVVFTLLTLVAVIYIFAVVFRHLSLDTSLETESGYFASVTDSMFTLTAMGLYTENIDELLAALRQEGILYVFLFATYLFVCTHTIMNFMVAVLCQVVGSLASRERLATLVHQTKSRLTDIIDANFPFVNKEAITKNDVLGICRDEMAVRTLITLDVDVADLLELLDTIFIREDAFEAVETIDFQQFLHFLVSLRGCNQATVRDLIHSRRAMYAYLNEVVATMEKAVERTSSKRYHEERSERAPSPDRSGGAGSRRHWEQDVAWGRSLGVVADRHGRARRGKCPAGGRCRAAAAAASQEGSASTGAWRRHWPVVDGLGDGGLAGHYRHGWRARCREEHALQHPVEPLRPRSSLLEVGLEEPASEGCESRRHRPMLRLGPRVLQPQARGPRRAPVHSPQFAGGYGGPTGHTGAALAHTAKAEG